MRQQTFSFFVMYGCFLGIFIDTRDVQRVKTSEDHSEFFLNLLVFLRQYVEDKMVLHGVVFSKCRKRLRLLFVPINNLFHSIIIFYLSRKFLKRILN